MRLVKSGFPNWIRIVQEDKNIGLFHLEYRCVNPKKILNRIFKKYIKIIIIIKYDLS